jgi:hypothetical protein
MRVQQFASMDMDKYIDTSTGVLLPHVSSQVGGVCVDVPIVEFIETKLTGRAY